MTINPIDEPIVPYAAVLYQTDSPISDNMRALCHGNSKETNLIRILELPKKSCLKQKNF